jgi:hypothetical protein
MRPGCDGRPRSSTYIRQASAGNTECIRSLRELQVCPAARGAASTATSSSPGATVGPSTDARYTDQLALSRPGRPWPSTVRGRSRGSVCVPTDHIRAHPYRQAAPIPSAVVGPATQTGPFPPHRTSCSELSEQGLRPQWPATPIGGYLNPTREKPWGGEGSASDTCNRRSVLRATQNRKTSATRELVAGCVVDIVQITCPRRNKMPSSATSETP